MKKEKIFKLFNLFSKKDEEQNSMEILDFKVTGYKTNTLRFWNLPECEMCFIDAKGRQWTAYSTFSELSMSLDINIRGLNTVETRLMGRITNPADTNFDFFYQRIDVAERLGGAKIGYALQEMLMKILFLVMEENNVLLKCIYGKIGTNGNDKPEYSMKLYKSFNNKEYNVYKVVLNPVGFNTNDCNLEYFIE